jgi:hypothetical protein
LQKEIKQIKEIKRTDRSLSPTLFREHDAFVGGDADVNGIADRRA